MALTDDQKKTINEILCAIAEMRIYLEQESQKHVVHSINMRTLSSKLEDTYQHGAALLKPEDMSKKTKAAMIRAGIEEEKK